MSQTVLLKLSVRPALAAMWILGLGACEPLSPPQEAMSPAKAIATAPAARPLGEAADFKPDAVAYRCVNGERLRVAYRGPDAALITYRGETHLLSLAPSTSGVRYAGDGWQWWIKDQGEGVFSRLPVDATIAPGGGVICELDVTTTLPSPIRSPGT